MVLTLTTAGQTTYMYSPMRRLMYSPHRYGASWSSRGISPPPRFAHVRLAHDHTVGLSLSRCHYVVRVYIVSGAVLSFASTASYSYALKRRPTQNHPHCHDVTTVKPVTACSSGTSHLGTQPLNLQYVSAVCTLGTQLPGDSGSCTTFHYDLPTYDSCTTFQSCDSV